jgi:GcrA cell cycle regulator
MVWTVQAIEALKMLASEGKSASAIAATLGAASRNAVIGKANRIGIRLNGDGRGTRSRAPAGIDRAQPAFIYRARPAGRTTAWSSLGAEVAEMRRVGFDQVQNFVCRWPLGDPMSKDFAYCGLSAAKGQSYCAGHCRMAYRSPNSTARQWRESRQSCAFANTWRLR